MDGLVDPQASLLRKKFDEIYQKQKKISEQEMECFSNGKGAQ